MKNLFKFAFVALALTAFTACNNEEAATETEATETEVITEDEVAAPMDETVVEDSTMMDTDSVTVVE